MILALHHLGAFSVIESWSGYFHATNPEGTAPMDMGSQAANDWADAHALVPELKTIFASYPYPKTHFGFYVVAANVERIAHDTPGVAHTITNPGRSFVFNAIGSNLGSMFIPLEPFLDFWPGVDLRQLAAEVSAALPVPSTCIYSRDDGIVSWSSCCDPNGAIADNVEVKGCHITMGRTLETLAVLASCLARPTAKASDN